MSDDFNNTLSQEEIDALLNAKGLEEDDSSNETSDEETVETVTREEHYDKRETVAQSAPSVTVKPAQFTSFERAKVNKISSNIERILDVPLKLTVELGRASKNVGEILDMGAGTVIELDKLAGEPVNIFVNGKRLACGEVVVIEENFGIRITEIAELSKRIKNLG